MEENYGKVTIAPHVLVTIVQKTASSVPGVDRLCDNAPGVKRILGRQTTGRGVDVSVEGSAASLAVDLSEWTKDYPRTYALEVAVSDVSLVWRPEAGGK